MNLKLITTHKDYILLVDEQIINAPFDKSDRFYNKHNGKVETSYALDESLDNKIIAHLPLNNAAVLEGVMLLPELPIDKVCTECGHKFRWNNGDKIATECIHCGGKLAASQNRRWTDRDLEDAYYEGGSGKGYSDFILYLHSITAPALPISFEPEYEEKYINSECLTCSHVENHDETEDEFCHGCGGYTLWKHNYSEKKLKTIKNEQGTEVLQGRWVYDKI